MYFIVENWTATAPRIYSPHDHSPNTPHHGHILYIVYFVCWTETLNILKSTCTEYIEKKILPIQSELSHYRHPKLNNNA